MGKLSKEDLQQIIAEQMPKYKLADTPAPTGAVDGRSTTRAKPEDQTPGLDELRRKYLRSKFLSDGSAGSGSEREPNGQPPAAAAADDGDDDTQIVIVEPKVAPHPLDRGSRPKAVVVSTAQKKIVGEQG